MRHAVRRERRGRGARRRGRPAHQEQATILQVTRLLHRVEVRGGAGSGKTVLALQQAKELTRGRGDRKAAAGRAALLLDRPRGAPQARGRDLGPRSHRPAFVGTFHEFGKQWGAPDGDRTDSDFWEERLPAADGRPGRGAARGKTVRRGHRRRGAGLRRLLVAPGAQVAARRGGGRALRLLRREPAHLRALRPAAGAARPAGARPQPPQHQADPRVVRPARAQPDVRHAAGTAPPSASCRRPRGRDRRRPTTRSTPCSRRAGGPRTSACSPPATGTRCRWNAPTSTTRTATGRRSGTTRTSSTATSSAARGWSAAPSSCASTSDEARDRARERLYVGMSRATDELVVVGDPAMIRAVAGDQVAHRLGI